MTQQLWICIILVLLKRPDCFVCHLWQTSLTGRPGLFLDYMWRIYIVTEAVTECVLSMTSPKDHAVGDLLIVAKLEFNIYSSYVAFWWKTHKNNKITNVLTLVAMVTTTS